MLLVLMGLVNVGSISLTVFGLMSGLRLNATQEQHPYDTFTTWRYGLGAVLPLFTVFVTLIYSQKPRSSILRDVHLVWSCVAAGMLAFISGYEIYVYTQCNDFTASSTPDHPQCQNRGYPINSHPDISWDLMAIGIWVSTAVGIWWIFYSFTLRWNTTSASQQSSSQSMVGLLLGRGVAIPADHHTAFEPGV